MIFRSFVAPETLPTPPDMTFITFRDALDFYARTAIREREEEQKLLEAFKKANITINPL